MAREKTVFEANKVIGAKQAIISDIHSNLESLSAIFADIETQEVDQIICLGDVVGYGANPRECLDMIMQRTDVCLLGNHDQGAMFDPEGFNAGAERAIFWTREQLETAPGSPAEREKRWEYLGERPRSHRDGNIGYVHGSPRNPLNEYVFPEDVYNRRKLERLFSFIRNCIFQGHTHVPGVFTEDLNFYSPEEIGHEYDVSEGKYMVNVGSVGQPRDGDPRACYVIFDGSMVRYRRVEYDVDKASGKIQNVPELDNFFAERLRDGR